MRARAAGTVEVLPYSCARSKHVSIFLWHRSSLSIIGWMFSILKTSLAFPTVSSDARLSRVMPDLWSSCSMSPVARQHSAATDDRWDSGRMWPACSSAVASTWHSVMRHEIYPSTSLICWHSSPNRRAHFRMPAMIGGIARTSPATSIPAMPIKTRRASNGASVFVTSRVRKRRLRPTHADSLRGVPGSCRTTSFCSGDVFSGAGLPKRALTCAAAAGKLALFFYFAGRSCPNGAQPWQGRQSLGDVLGQEERAAGTSSVQ